MGEIVGALGQGEGVGGMPMACQRLDGAAGGGAEACSTRRRRPAPLGETALPLCSSSSSARIAARAADPQSRSVPESHSGPLS
jgi:hypothetical protein